MMKITMKGIPSFRILDYKAAIDYYIEGLGFQIDWEHRFGPEDPVYMQISRNGLTLHLTENNRFQPGVIAFVECRGLVEFHNEISKNQKTIEIPQIQYTDWQTLQVELEDPFGNLLRFNEAK